MRLYTQLSTLTNDTLKKVLQDFFQRCDSINIYFPNNPSEEILAFKKAFLHATSIIENPPYLEDLEEKEGFTMFIVSLNTSVQNLLLDSNLALHLSFGLIKDNNVLLYVGDEGECVIESTEDDIQLLKQNCLFDCFKPIA